MPSQTAQYVVSNGNPTPCYMRVMSGKIDWLHRIEWADAFPSAEEALSAYRSAKESMMEAGMKKLAKAQERGALSPPLPEGWREGSRLLPGEGEYTLGKAAQSLASIKSISRAKDPLAFFCPKWLSDALMRPQSEWTSIVSRAQKLDLHEDLSVHYVKTAKGWMGKSEHDWNASIMLARGFSSAEEAKTAMAQAKVQGHVVGVKMAMDSIERVGSEPDPECDAIAARLEAKELAQASSGDSPAPERKAKRM